jgi:hypothetical protein
MFIQPRPVAIVMIAAAVIGITVYGCCGLTRHAIVAIDKWGDAGVQLGRAGDAATQVAAKVNGENGTIAMLNEDIGAAKSMLIHADLVARHEQQQLSTWDKRGAELCANVNGAVSDLRTTVQKAGDTEDAASKFVEVLRLAAADKDNGLGAVLANVNGGMGDVRSMASDGRRITKATAGTMEHVEGITGDIQVQTHKLNAPKTKMQRVIDTAPVAVKVAWMVCVLSGHC